MMRDLGAEREREEAARERLERSIRDARTVAVWALREMQETPGWQFWRLRYLESVWRRKRDEVRELEEIRAAP